MKRNNGQKNRQTRYELLAFAEVPNMKSAEEIERITRRKS